MIRRLIHKLADKPVAFNWLRRILEGGFKTQQSIITRYFHLDVNSRVLDIGCGTGEFAPLFAEFDYTGIDTESRYIDYAKKNYKGTFLTGDARRLPFPDATFSHSIIIGVLHHLNDENSRQVLREMSRTVRKSGKILIMEDVRTDSDNLLTRLLHNLDKGADIRTRVQYQKLIGSVLPVEDDFYAKSGVIPYQIFVIKNEGRD